jgi:hypothetical protein
MLKLLEDSGFPPPARPSISPISNTTRKLGCFSRFAGDQEIIFLLISANQNQCLSEWAFEFWFSKIKPHSLIHRTLAQAGDLLVAVLVAI